MSLPTKTRQIILAKQPMDKVNISEHFKHTDTDLPSLQDDQLLVKVLYLSNDPAQRAWIQAGQDEARLYMPPVKAGQVMQARAVTEVIESKSASFKKGALVLANTGWSQYAVIAAKEARPAEKMDGLSVTHFLGAFGGPGLTAMHGLHRVNTSDKDDLVVISGAAGATGSMAVQVAKKLLGVKKVVGIAGTDEKCRWVEKLGADKCLNYKSASFADDLAATCQGKANVYFDNVGGEILDLMLNQMAMYSRVIACGAISQYNAGEEPMKLRNWAQVIFMRIEIAGILVFDAAPRSKEYTEKLTQGYKDGRLIIDVENETVVPTKFDDIPKTWLKLFEGGNTGKLITKIDD